MRSELLKEVHERTTGARFGKPEPKKTKRKDESATGGSAELAAPEAEQAEEVERSGAVSTFDEEPATA